MSLPRFIRAIWLCSAVLGLSLFSTKSFAADQPPPATTEPRLAWWRDGRFGMFIHYGPVTLTGKEISWSRANSNPKCPNQGSTPAAAYDNLYKEFNPTNFDASAWTRLARAAGMKYVVLTAKHCDGFLLWHSKTDLYNISATRFQRDLCAELAAAVRNDGLKLGWYFSPMDWRDPEFRTERNAAFLARMQGELRELLTGYGRIDLLWFDWDGREPLYDQANTYALAKKSQPEIIINNRLDLGIGDSDQQIKSRLADYYTPEQHIGSYDDQRPWETCMTLGTQWSWKPDDRIKGAAEVVSILARTVGGDGNLLLNIGPMPDGRIEPRQADVLKALGKWMAKNSESIYGTRGGPWKPTKTLASTRKGNSVFLHILPSADRRIELPELPLKVTAASLITGGKVEFSQSDGNVVVVVPEAKLDSFDTVVRLDFASSVMTLPALSLPARVRASASNTFRNETEQYGPAEAFDGDPATRWASDSGMKQAWIAADFGRPRTITRVAIEELFDRVTRCQLEYREGAAWKPIFTAQRLGMHFERKFTPVKAQEFRLHILEATDGPSIAEIGLLE